MKRFLPALIIILIMTGSFAMAQRLPKLRGQVRYENGTDVGAKRPVIVYAPDFAPVEILTRPEGYYGFSFNAPQYFEKVSCRFYSGGIWYSGTSMIESTLYHDTYVDIIVYPEP